jgi:hypothetical protein
MFKSTLRALLTLAAIFLLGNSLWAQNAQAQTSGGDITKEQWEKLFSSANESAILNNGKVSFLKLAVPNAGEKQFTFAHAADGKSFTMTDENGLQLGVSLSTDRRIQSVTMPNGEKIVFIWTQDASGNWIPKNLECNGNLVEGPNNNGNPCRDAAVAAAIAIGLCAAMPGSISCWSATANAAYHAYRCYEATHWGSSPNNKNLRNYARRFDFGQKTSNKERTARYFSLHNN